MPQGFFQGAAFNAEPHRFTLKRYDVRAIRPVHEEGYIKPPESFRFSRNHIQGAVVA